jgi:homoserine dehydrogenase
MTRASLRVGVLGAGTVGRQVIRGVLDDAGRLAGNDGCRLALAGVAVRDVEAAARRGIPRDLLTDAPAHLVASPETDVIVELMGGAEPARTLIAAALSAGKAVVTANKQVIAHRGPELEALSRRTGTALRFEAAVGGGIPVLGPVAAELAANEITRVRGIVNGTTNFILSEMALRGREYADVLASAQERGYAEADPTGDVEGRDAVNKLVILARLAFDVWLDPASVVDRPPAATTSGKPGITGVSSHEMLAASALGLRLRLLASATRLDSGRIDAAVMPTAVPADSSLGRTSGVQNRIEVRARPVGDLGFDGPGAGGEATSSAVLGDLVAIARGQGSTWAGRPAADTGRAADPLTSGQRCWFAFVSEGADVGEGSTDLRDLEVAELSGGLAVRTPLMTLAMARDRLAGAAALYPIDD